MNALPEATIRIATRPSRLARRQTELVRDLLRQRWPSLAVEVVVIHTQGDRQLAQPLPEIGGKGLFTAELEQALRSSQVDLAVHSLKDLPIDDAPGLIIAAILMRSDPGEVLVAPSGYTLQSLPPGAVVGTSSPRRQAQLLHLRPDLQVRSIRGNVETRVRKVEEGQYDAALMAAAGLTRLGMQDHISQRFSPLDILPAPGQGALAVQCRAGDPRLLALVQGLDDPASRRAAQAERAFLAALGGGCSAPVGAYARAAGPTLALTGIVAAVDGTHLVRVHGQGQDPTKLGRELAQQAIIQGAQELLNDAGN